MILVIVFINNKCFAIGKDIKNEIKITGKIYDTNVGDTMFLYYWNHYLSSSRDGAIGRKVAKCPIVNGKFQFSIPSTPGLVYFSLGNKFMPMTNSLYTILNLYIAEPNDDVFIDIGNDYIKFSGKGAEKYMIKSQLDRITTKQVDIFENYLKNNPDSGRFYIYRATYDSILVNQIAVLKQKQSNLSRAAFHFFLAEIIGYNQYQKLHFIYNQLSHSGAKIPDSWASDMKINKLLRRQQVYWTQQKETASTSFSRYYTDFLILNAIIKARQYNLTAINPYLLIVRFYKGKLKDKLLAAYFLSDYGHKYGDLKKERYLPFALKQIKNKYYFDQLYELDHNIHIGGHAYNFSLWDKNGNTIKLSNFIGHTVLLDFWFTGCSGCIQFYQQILSKLEEKYRNNKSVVFISISPDINDDVWIKSIEKNLYTSPNMGNVINLHSRKGLSDAVFEHYNVSSMPYQYIIDKRGNISCYNIEWNLDVIKLAFEDTKKY